MSLSNPPRRLLQSATALLPQSHFYPPFACPHLHQRRTAIRDILKNPFKSRKQREYVDPKTLDPGKALEARKAEQQQQLSNRKLGDIAEGSILDTIPKAGDDDVIEEKAVIRDPNNMSAVLDPHPRSRVRWQRKMVIREIRGRGRMNKTVKRARTERSHLSKSEMIKTSVKKLYPLARQIAGKPLEEAMVQMRFSRKRAAQDVLRHLEYARDQAVVVKGMGLGKVREQAQLRRLPQEKAEVEEEGREPESPKEGLEIEPEVDLVVEDKKGKKRVVKDRTAMYVDEAWVGRGTYGTGYDYRARGRVNRLQLPYTSISVVLKEEVTRIRQAEDREAKRQRKKVWVPLPDRAVTAQRQYPLW